MSPDLKACETSALQLPLKDRAALAESLLASLEGQDEADIEQLWLIEAERRYKEYMQGKIAARPAADVIRDARSALQ